VIERGGILLGRPRGAGRFATGQAATGARHLGRHLQPDRLATSSRGHHLDTALATMPGNVFLPASATGLPRDSVVNVTALVTLNKTDLSEHVGDAPPALLNEVDRGLRRVLDL